MGIAEVVQALGSIPSTGCGVACWVYFLGGLNSYEEKGPIWGAGLEKWVDQREETQERNGWESLRELTFHLKWSPYLQEVSDPPLS
jgi:hypothetical protein